MSAGNHSEKSSQDLKISSTPMARFPMVGNSSSCTVNVHPDDPMNRYSKFLAQRTRNRKGQTLVEYALILAFISVVAISVLIRLGDEVKLIFTTITSQLAVASSSH